VDTRTFVTAGLVALALFHASGLDAQERPITGQVTRAESGLALPAAEVAIMNPGRFTPAVTSQNGRFVISAPQGGVRLLVSAFGYSPAEVEVAPDQSSVAIALVPDAFLLSELVVTGQATTIDRRSATTAIALRDGR
jgi:hypothetical protein